MPDFETLHLFEHNKVDIGLPVPEGSHFGTCLARILFGGDRLL